MSRSGVATVMLVAAGLIVALAGGPAVPQDPPGSGFRPGEISIGEPLALPFGGATSAPPASVPAASGSGSVLSAPAAAVGLPGSGWLGLSLAESTVPGRWRIDEVMPGGPAARAGIEPGDELRAVNGAPLAGAEEVSAVMTAIASGQAVRVAVARDDELRELVLDAVPRPPVAQPDPTAASPPITRQPFQSAPPQSAPPQSAPLQSQSAPPQSAPPQSAVGEAPNPIVAGQRPTNPWGSGSLPITTPPAYAPQSAVPPREVLPRSVPSQAPVQVAPVRDAGVRDFAATEAVPSGSRLTGSVAAGGRIALGVRTLPIDAVTQSRFNLPEQAGAYVLGVVQDLPASRAGVPPGSVIVALDGRPVRSPDDLTQIVTAGPLDRPVTLQFVLPGGESRRASVALQSLEAPVVEALAGPRAVGSIPTLEPGPRRSERPVPAGSGTDAEATAIRQEVRLLRERLERLERRLQSAEPSLRR